MKKILIGIVTMLTLCSCSLISKDILISNREINSYVSKKMNISQNYILARANIKNLDTRVRNGKIYSDLGYDYAILGGTVAESKGKILINYDLEIKDNKLYLKNPNVVDFTSEKGLIADEKVKKLLIDLVLNGLTYAQIQDFGTKYKIKDIKMVNNRGILLIME